MTADEVRRVVSRMAHQIVERQKGVRGLVFAGIHTRGLPLAERLARKIGEIEGEEVPVAPIDIRRYRDDLPTNGESAEMVPLVPLEVDSKRVIIVDDVLFTGRSIRAALDALTAAGRPQQVQLAVLVDRGHREIPIRADYVGKNMPTSLYERVQVRLKEVDGKDEVVLIQPLEDEKPQRLVTG